MLVAFLDLQQLDMFHLVVMVVVELGFVEDCEVVVVAEVACPQVHPHQPLVGLDLVHPGFDNVGVIEPVMPLVLVHGVVVEHVEVLVKGVVDLDDFVSHVSVQFNYMENKYYCEFKSCQIIYVFPMNCFTAQAAVNLWLVKGYL